MIGTGTASKLTRAEARLSQRYQLTALNAASAATRNGWLAFLLLMVWLAVALAGVTHEGLLIEAPVTLPLLGVGIGLGRFFLFAPLFLLFAHAGLMVQHCVLAHKIKAFNGLIQLEEHPDLGVHHPLRDEVHSYFFTQVHAGPSHNMLLRGFLRVIVWSSLWVLPVILFLYFQIAFLPFHDAAVTAAHRTWLLADLGLLAVTGLVVNAPGKAFAPALGFAIFRRPLRFGFGVAGATAVLFFSFLVATIPDGFLDRATRTLPIAPGPAAAVGGTNTWLRGIFRRNLVVTDRDLVPGAGSIHDASDREVDPAAGRLSLRNRDLRYATLDRSDLHRVDFTGADLTGASLRGADLSGARLSCPRSGSSFEDTAIFRPTAGRGICTKLIGADLTRARLGAADLRSADLTGARLSESRLEKALLQQARLTNADLTYAKLEGADLSLADLQLADLSWSNLRGADLSVASLHGANLQNADLHAANLSYAKLYAANLSYARLNGASLRNAALQGADLSQAVMPGADFRATKIWLTKPPGNAGVSLTNFEGMKVSLLDAEEKKALKATPASMPGASLREALRETLAVLLDEDQSAAWLIGRARRKWVTFKTATRRDDDAGFRMAITSRLSTLACNDRTEKGYLINGIVRRALHKFDGDPLLIFHQITQGNCRAAGKVSTALLEKLQNAAFDFQKNGGGQ